MIASLATSQNWKKIPWFWSLFLLWWNFTLWQHEKSSERGTKNFIREEKYQSSHILRKKGSEVAVIRQCDLRGSQKPRRNLNKFYFLIWPLAKFVSFLLSMIATVSLPHKIGKEQTMVPIHTHGVSNPWISNFDD
jgi:hypothetical protein